MQPKKWPAGDGVYWWRNGPGWGWSIVEVRGEDAFWPGCLDPDPVAKLSGACYGEWVGPIVDPTGRPGKVTSPAKA